MTSQFHFLVSQADPCPGAISSTSILFLHPHLTPPHHQHLDTRSQVGTDPTAQDGCPVGTLTVREGGAAACARSQGSPALRVQGGNQSLFPRFFQKSSCDYKMEHSSVPRWGVVKKKKITYIYIYISRVALARPFLCGMDGHNSITFILPVLCGGWEAVAADYILIFNGMKKKKAFLCILWHFSDYKCDTCSLKMKNKRYYIVGNKTTLSPQHPDTTTTNILLCFLLSFMRECECVWVCVCMVLSKLGSSCSHSL